MSEKITVYQKPTCSKCRTALGVLEDRGVEFEAIDYYERPLSADDLRGLVEKLGLSPRDLLRAEEPIARSLRLADRDVPDDELLELMAKHPDLIQRPIVVRGDRAVLARPVEELDRLLE